MPKDPLRPQVEALRAAVAEGAREPRFRRAWADLRETCAPALGAKGDLVALVARYLATDLRRGVVAEAVERALEDLRLDREGWPRLPVAVAEAPADAVDRLVARADEAMREHFGKPLAEARVLDPFAGAGAVVAGVVRRGGKENVFANEARLEPYLLAAQRLEPFEGLCFANTLTLPERGPTPGFDFDAEPNSERLRRQRDSRIDVVLSDLRGTKVRPYFEWAGGRLEEGAAAFLDDGAWIDDPALGAMRERLEREYGLVLHEEGITLFVRHPSLRPPARVFYNGGELHPTAAHVWRTEILREEWAGFMPLVGGRSFFVEGFEGAPAGHDAPEPSPKARPVVRRPFSRVWRRPLKRGAPYPPDGLTLVTLDEPFGAFVATALPDRRLGRAYPFRVGARENVSPWALARLRAAYGPGLTERDAFDYLVALLHHPGYRERYREDLRRGTPRVPLLDLEPLLDVQDAPPVGPGTAFGTGWTPPRFFEEGTVPEYDDPFASPYARADVEPGFLLFAGLGAALTHLQTFHERVVGEPLERVEARGATRVAKDRVVVGDGLALVVPMEALDYRVGRKSALAWLVEGMKGRDVESEAAAQRVERMVAMSLEALRLVRMISETALPTDVQ